MLDIHKNLIYLDADGALGDNIGDDLFDGTIQVVQFATVGFPAPASLLPIVAGLAAITITRKKV